MRRRITTVLVCVIAAVAVVFAGVDASLSGSSDTPRAKLTMIAPADPGGGWDSFAREAQQAMRTNGVVGNVQVVNIPGAGGTIGLGQISEMPERHDVMLVGGGVMVGGIIINESSVTLDDVTPIARVADDYNVLVVPGDSPYETLEDFVEAYTEDPEGMAIAGGSLGSIDHILAGLLTEATVGDPQRVNYIAYAGGGEVVSSLLSHTTVAGISGYNDFSDQIEAGNLRALAISAPEAPEGIDVPTFRDAGLDIAMINWRGLFGAPGIDEETQDELVEIVDEMRQTPEWQDALERNRWVDSFMTGDEFEQFLDDEVATYEETMEGLGL